MGSISILTENIASLRSNLKGQKKLKIHFKLHILLSTFSSSPFAYVDPLHCNMAYLYLELLKDSLNEYAYAAELAGLNYDLQNTIYGMYVSTQIKEELRALKLLPLINIFILIWWKDFHLKKMGLRLLLILILIINHPSFNLNFKLNFVQSLQQSFHSY